MMKVMNTHQNYIIYSFINRIHISKRWYEILACGYLAFTSALHTISHLHGYGCDFGLQSDTTVLYVHPSDKLIDMIQLWYYVQIFTSILINGSVFHHSVVIHCAFFALTPIDLWNGRRDKIKTMAYKMTFHENSINSLSGYVCACVSTQSNFILCDCCNFYRSETGTTRVRVG